MRLTAKVMYVGMLALFGAGTVSQAAYKWEGFDGGNAPGFIKLGDYTWNEHDFPHDYRQWRATGLSWGAIQMTSKITVEGARCEGSGFWMNSGGWKKATFEARTLISGGASGSGVYSWAAWWIYNNVQTYNNYYEVDLMECCDTGNYFNYYYHWNNGVVGKQKIMPSSFNWRTSWNKYKCWVAQVPNVHYYLNGTWMLMHAGVDRTSEYGMPKFQNRVWPTKVKADNAGVQDIPHLVADWYQVWY